MARIRFDENYFICHNIADTRELHSFASFISVLTALERVPLCQLFFLFTPFMCYYYD